MVSINACSMFMRCAVKLSKLPLPTAAPLLWWLGDAPPRESCSLMSRKWITSDLVPPPLRLLFIEDSAYRMESSLLLLLLLLLPCWKDFLVSFTSTWVSSTTLVCSSLSMVDSTDCMRWFASDLDLICFFFSFPSTLKALDWCLNDADDRTRAERRRRRRRRRNWILKY